MQKDARMLETPIPRLILSCALPAMTSLTLVAVYNMADALFVSSLGSGATGALSALLPLNSIIQAIGFTFGMGGASLISRSLGRGDRNEAGEYAASAFWSALLLAVIFAVTGMFLLKPMVRFFGAPEALLDDTAYLAGFFLAASPSMITGFVLSNLLRSMGRTGAALLGIGTGSLLNIALDALFIFTFHMGVRGVGPATLISQTLGTLLLLWLFHRYRGKLSIHPRELSLYPGTYGWIFLTGLPSLFRQGLAMLSSIFLNHQAAAAGEDALAAMGIVGKIFMIFFSVSLGLGQGYQPVAGYNYGAGRYRRLRRAFSFTLWLSIALMTALGAGVYFTAPDILPLFTNEQAVIDIALPALRSLCLIFPLLSVAALANLTFQAIGRPVLSTFLASARQGLFFIPLILLLPAWWGLSGIQYAQTIADFLTAFLCLPFLICFVKQCQKKG